MRIVHYADCVASHLLAVSRLFSEPNPNGGCAEVETDVLNAYALKPVGAMLELVDWIIDNLEDLACSVEPISVFAGEFFEYSIVFELPD